MKEIKIGNKTIGLKHKPYFIADIAANHDGSLDRAFKLIELAKECGADAAKFQNFHAEKIVSKYGFDNLKQKLSHQKEWKKSVFEVYKDASIPLDWTPKLKEKCDEVGIEYFTSPYDFESIDFVDPYVKCYKIGSGDITWHDIIEYMAKKGKPILIAIGASEMYEVEQAINIIEKYNKEIVIMQCNTNYTASLENIKYINLEVINTLKTKYPDYILGLSDHTKYDSVIVGALAMGSRVFERHFTDDNSREGPDHKFAMNPTDWKNMVKVANEIFQALGDGIKKIEDNEKDSVIVQRRCIRTKLNLKKGTMLKEEYFDYLRPAPIDSFKPYEKNLIIGKKINRDIESGDYIKKGDIE